MTRVGNESRECHGRFQLMNAKIIMQLLFCLSLAKNNQPQGSTAPMNQFLDRLQQKPMSLLWMQSPRIHHQESLFICGENTLPQHPLTFSQRDLSIRVRRADVGRSPPDVRQKVVADFHEVGREAKIIDHPLPQPFGIGQHDGGRQVGSTSKPA